MPASLHKVSDSAIRRLSIYLRVLGGLEREGEETVSSQVLADRAGTTAAQVRKDLSLFGSFGKRGLGYLVTTLRDELRGILGVSRKWRVALVGIGRMGAALLEYPHFRARGFEFAAVYDSDPEKVGSRRGMLTVEDAQVLEESLREAGIEIVVLTVPAAAAQEVADAAVRALLAALGLHAHELAFGRGFALRSGAELRPRSTVATWLGADGDDPIDLGGADTTLALLMSAREHAASRGVPLDGWGAPATRLTPKANLSAAIRSTWPVLD